MAALELSFRLRQENCITRNIDCHMVQRIKLVKGLGPSKKKKNILCHRRKTGTTYMCRLKKKL